MPSHSFAVTHSSAVPNWRTEDALFAALDREFCFGLDAAATRANTKVPLDRTSCAYFGPDHRFGDVRDALAVKDWTDHVPGMMPIFCNPPSSRDEGISLEPWLWKFVEQARLGATIVGVIPHKTSTSWWQACRLAVEIREIPHRVKYWLPDDELAEINAERKRKARREGKPFRPLKSGDSAGFDTAVVIWRPQPGVLGAAAPRVVTWTYRDGYELAGRP